MEGEGGEIACFVARREILEQTNLLLISRYGLRSQILLHVAKRTANKVKVIYILLLLQSTSILGFCCTSQIRVLVLRA